MMTFAAVSASTGTSVTAVAPLPTIDARVTASIYTGDHGSVFVFSSSRFQAYPPARRHP
jgi:hypothetical protein